MNYIQNALAHVALFGSGRILILILLIKNGLTNHLLRKGIHCGYELRKKHFILFNWFLFVYEPITFKAVFGSSL